MKLFLKTDDGHEIELQEKELDLSKDKVTVFQLPVEEYCKESILAIKKIIR